MEALTEKLERLEGMVKELLDELKKVKSEKEDLEIRLAAKEKELTDLRANLSPGEVKTGEDLERLEYIERLESERDEIRAKVSEMLAELEKIKEAEEA